jgi:hypothetical protein
MLLTVFCRTLEGLPYISLPLWSIVAAKLAESRPLVIYLNADLALHDLVT